MDNFRGRSLQERATSRISKATGVKHMTDHERRVFDLAFDLIPHGHYHACEYDVIIELKDGTLSVTITSLTKPNYLVNFCDNTVTYGVGHLSWWNIEGTAAKHKAIDTILHCLEKINKKVNHKPLIKVVSEWLCRKNKGA